MDWQVLGDEERLPSAPAENEPRARRAWARLWRWLLLGLLLVATLGAAVVWQARQREEELRADLEATIEREARAQLFGVAAQAREFADPAAPQIWRERYAALFHPQQSDLPPAVTRLALQEGRALVDVTWPGAPTPIIEQRAYRVVGGAWRRSPLPLEAWEAAGTRRTTHFSIQANAADLAAFSDDPALRLNLERLRSRVVTYWPDAWADFFLAITVQPQELSGPVLFIDAQKLLVNSPDLALVDPAAPLPREAQVRLAITTAVVEWLATPESLRRPFFGDRSGRFLETPDEGVNNWWALWRILQAAEARHWALDSAQRRLLRNAWRAELAGTWPDPFAGPLPLSPEGTDPAARRRWLAVSLLVERQIEIGDVGTPGRLATILATYPTGSFQPGPFFAALIGGSEDNVEQLSRPYILTLEPDP